jgi:hypothetical protein
VRGGAEGEGLPWCVRRWLTDLERLGLFLSLVLQEVERNYLLFKARQEAEKPGGGGVSVVRGKAGVTKEALLNFVLFRLKPDLFPDVMEYMG